VFFVSQENPGTNISQQQVREIYSGQVKNWAQINGWDQKIIPFQRPENSGSQTILQSVMGETPIMPPLKEEYVSGMGGIVEQVAEYRDEPGALGYSFRFFLTGMTADAQRVKMLSVDGIAPDWENISTGVYPYTVDLYAITVRDNPLPTVSPFLAWMQSAQGQQLVEQIGYVPLPEGEEQGPER